MSQRHSPRTCAAPTDAPATPSNDWADSLRVNGKTRRQPAQRNDRRAAAPTTLLMASAAIDSNGAVVVVGRLAHTISPSNTHTTTLRCRSKRQRNGNAPPLRCVTHSIGLLPSLTYVAGATLVVRRRSAQRAERVDNSRARRCARRRRRHSLRHIVKRQRRVIDPSLTRLFETAAGVVVAVLEARARRNGLRRALLVAARRVASEPKNTTAQTAARTSQSRTRCRRRPLS